MRNALKLPFSWVKSYTFLLLVFALWGNDFLSFNYPFLDFGINPFRFWILGSPFVLFLSPPAFWTCFRKSKARFYVFFLVVMMLYAALSVFWVQDKSGWMQQGMFLGTGSITTFLIVGCIGDIKDLKQGLRVFWYVACFVALGGLIEVLFSYYFYVDPSLREMYEWERQESFMHLHLPVFSMGNVNDFASFCFFALVGTSILWWTSQEKKKKIVYGISMLLFVFLILCAQSRSVFLGLALAFLMGLVLFFRRKTKERPLLFCGLFLALMGVLLLATVGIIDLMMESSAGRTELKPGSDAIRMGVMKNAWYFFKQDWYRGLGWGGIDYYNLHYPLYTAFSGPPHLHNWWLEILFSCGVFIFLPYVFGYIKSGWILCKITYNARTNSAILAGILLMAMVGFLGVSLASSSFVSAHWFWAVAALGASSYSIILSNQTDAD